MNFSKIKNYADLATSDARRVALEIAEAGLEAIDTEAVVRNNVVLREEVLAVQGVEIPLREVKRIFVVGVGKCAGDAAYTMYQILGDRIHSGVALGTTEMPPMGPIARYRGTHPLPSPENMKGARAIVDMLQRLTPEDLVLCIITGGGSTLLCLPDGGGCDEEAEVFTALTKGGATIQELNTVRKHLSLVRGGYLAKYAYPARVVSLIFSDVPADDISFIASGPTVQDTTTIKDAEEVLKKYGVLETCTLDRCRLIETPKEDLYFKKVSNVLVVSNKIALEAMKTKAQELGFSAEVRTTSLTGEAREVATSILAELHGASSRSVFLYGGETTVAMKIQGKGGRNLELALSGLLSVQEGELLMPIASDGRDNTDFAGAICDTLSKEKASTLGLDARAHLDEHQSYDFWNKVRDFLRTGDTGSNVSDLVIAIKE